MREITVNQFLTDAEIAQAIALGNAADIDAQIITPNLARINAALGQENDARYLAYLVEFVISQVKGVVSQ